MKDVEIQAAIAVDGTFLRKTAGKGWCTGKGDAVDDTGILAKGKRTVQVLTSDDFKSKAVEEFGADEIDKIITKANSSYMASHRQDMAKKLRAAKGIAAPTAEGSPSATIGIDDSAEPV